MYGDMYCNSDMRCDKSSVSPMIVSEYHIVINLYMYSLVRARPMPPSIVCVVYNPVKSSITARCFFKVLTLAQHTTFLLVLLDATDRQDVVAEVFKLLELFLCLLGCSDCGWLHLLRESLGLL